MYKHNIMQSHFSTYLFLFSMLISANSVSGDKLSDADINKLSEAMKKEMKLNGAAMEVFWGLRDKFGERIRLTGSLIYCDYKTLASSTQPTMYEMMIEANDILDTVDLSFYDINEVDNKIRLTLSRRAITATTAYGFSASELGEFVEKIKPGFKSKYCQTTLGVCRTYHL